MNSSVAEKLQALADVAGELEREYEVERWSARVKSFLTTTLGVDAATTFVSLLSSDWTETLAMRRGHLDGLVAMGNASSQQEEKDVSEGAPETAVRRSASRKIFIVHGHDGGPKESLARFVVKLGLDPVILHEQPNGGRTIIEKFETYSDDVAFAVVLLTPDDLGSESSDPSHLRPRARQNVIMELGYFIGRLGRTRVCALLKGDVERPSDYQGVLYVELDDAGGWKARLAQELIQSKISIDLAGLLG